MKHFFSGKKSAIQLTMGFMVMLIIAIVVFVLSLNFLGQFFKQAELMQKNLDEQTRNDISRLLAGNARVAIPKDTMTIKQGQTDVIGIGIKNTINVNTFHIEILDGKYYSTATGTNAQGNSLSCIDGICNINAGLGVGVNQAPLRYQISRAGTLSIPPNKDDTALMTLAVDKKAPPGLYSLSIGVCGLTTSSVSEKACTKIIQAATPSGQMPDYTKLYGGTIYKIRVTVK